MKIRAGRLRFLRRLWLRLRSSLATLDGVRFLPWCPSRAQMAARRNVRTFQSAIPVRMLDALAFGNPSTSCSFLLGAAVRPPLAADLSSAAEDCLFLLRQDLAWPI